jgi:hypothetical protein
MTAFGFGIDDGNPTLNLCVKHTAAVPEEGPSWVLVLACPHNGMQGVGQNWLMTEIYS